MRLYVFLQSFFRRIFQLDLKLTRIDGPLSDDDAFEICYVPAVDLTLLLDLRESLDLAYAGNQVDETCFNFLRARMAECTGFLDVGANQGIYSCLVLHEFPSVHVGSIEPDPYSLEKFRKNIQLNRLDSSRLKIFECAVGTEEGRGHLMLNVAGNRAGSSMVVDQRQWTGLEANVEIEVQMKSLAEVFSELNFSRETLMKMDIEGMEFPVLQSFFRETQMDEWPRHIIVEAFGSTIPLVGGTPIMLLMSLGYELIDHDPGNFCFSLPAQM
jgi:FkbM family methyltransferase